MLTAIVSILYYLVLLAWSLAYFVFMLLLFALTVAFDRERKALHAASRFWARSIFFLNPLWRLRVEGREHIDPKGAYVVTVNHQSMVDIPLMYVLPLNFKWVSKKEVQKMPIFGWVLWMHGDIPVERGSRRSAKRMMERCVERLSRGTSVIVFPEGTRTRTGEIGRFKDGAFLVAKSAGVGIQPVVIDGTWSLMKGWRVRMPHTFRVRVLDPIPPERVASSEARELAGRTEALMKEAHGRMLSEGK